MAAGDAVSADDPAGGRERGGGTCGRAACSPIPRRRGATRRSRFRHRSAGARARVGPGSGTDHPAGPRAEGLPKQSPHTSRSRPETPRAGRRTGHGPLLVALGDPRRWPRPETRTDVHDRSVRGGCSRSGRPSAWRSRSARGTGREASDRWLRVFAVGPARGDRRLPRVRDLQRRRRAATADRQGVGQHRRGRSSSATTCCRPSCRRSAAPMQFEQDVLEGGHPGGRAAYARTAADPGPRPPFSDATARPPSVRCSRSWSKYPELGAPPERPGSPGRDRADRRRDRRPARALQRPGLSSHNARIASGPGAVPRADLRVASARVLRRRAPRSSPAPIPSSGRHEPVRDRPTGRRQRQSGWPVMARPMVEPGRHTGRTDIPLTDAGRGTGASARRPTHRPPFALVLTSPLLEGRRDGRLAEFARCRHRRRPRRMGLWRLRGRTTADIREVSRTGASGPGPGAAAKRSTRSRSGRPGDRALPGSARRRRRAAVCARPPPAGPGGTLDRVPASRGGISPSDRHDLDPRLGAHQPRHRDLEMKPATGRPEAVAGSAQRLDDAPAMPGRRFPPCAP